MEDECGRAWRGENGCMARVRNKRGDSWVWQQQMASMRVVEPHGGLLRHVLLLLRALPAKVRHVVWCAGSSVAVLQSHKCYTSVSSVSGCSVYMGSAVYASGLNKERSLGRSGAKRLICGVDCQGNTRKDVGLGVARSRSGEASWLVPWPGAAPTPFIAFLRISRSLFSLHSCNFDSVPPAGCDMQLDLNVDAFLEAQLLTCVTRQLLACATHS